MDDGRAGAQLDERLDRVRRERLALAYDDFALSLARRFPSRREQFDDLAQVARIGLLKAIDRFDSGRGQPFTGFARATITGEMKRHIRDKTWSLRVPRSLQEQYLIVVRTVDDLSHELGRSPTIGEVAGRAGITQEQVIEGMELGTNQRPMSFDVPTASGRALDPGMPDGALTSVEDRETAQALMDSLPERERRIVELRFRDGRTQREIADEIGMSQMYVSRLLARILERLRRTCALN